MQANKVLILSRDATRMPTGDLNVKAELAATNHPCWVLTSGPSILETHNKCYIKINKRSTAKSVRGKRIESSGYRTRIEAEMDLFLFR